MPTGRRHTLEGGRGRRFITTAAKEHCRIDEESSLLLENTMSQMSFSARAHDRILRVARTIADLADSANITADHLLEAIGYRTLDRNLLC
jgi:magnesium chelatase family protein